MRSALIATQPVPPDQPSTKAAVAMIGTVLLGTGSFYGLERANVWLPHLQSRMPIHLEVSRDRMRRPDVRTMAEHVENIRRVLNPSVTTLAILFDVSRQAIYKWLAGSSVPEQEKQARIVELSQIADEFQAAGVLRADALLTMKAFDGKSLVDLIRVGENRKEHVAALLSEAQAMESSYRASGLSSAVSPPTKAWQSSISIPGSFEHD